MRRFGTRGGGQPTRSVSDASHGFITWLATGIALGAAAWWFSQAHARFLTFHNRTFDLAFYTRMAWGYGHANLWDPVVGAWFWGLHITPLLLPVGLLGWVLPTVPMLLALQSVAVACAAWPMARFAERRAAACMSSAVAPRWVATALSVGWAALWCLHPNWTHVLTEEFHPGTVAVLPLAWALECLDRRDARGLRWSVLGVLACREDFALLTALLGLLAWRGQQGQQGERVERDAEFSRVGKQIFAGSVAYLLLFFLVLHPLFAPTLGSMKLHFGELLRRPWAALTRVARPRAGLYLLQVLGVYALLPLASRWRQGWLLLAAPTLLMNVLSEFAGTASLDSHYLTPALAPLWFAAVDGLERICSSLGGWRSTAPVGPRGGASFGLGMIAWGCATAVAFYFVGNTPWSRSYTAEAFQWDAGSHDAARIVRAVPKDRAVQAPDRLLAHLAERDLVFRAPPPDRNARYVVLDVAHRRRFKHQESLIRTVEEPVARDWLARGDAALVRVHGDLLLFERGRAPRSGVAQSYFLPPPAQSTTLQPRRALTQCLSLVDARVFDRTLVLTLFAEDPCPHDLVVRLGTGYRPRRVDLLFDGLLSPAHLRRGDFVHSRHELTAVELDDLRLKGLRVGVLRSSGARPFRSDPMAITVADVAFTRQNDGAAFTRQNDGAAFTR
jgi:uncharacterized membrane protein